MFYFDNASTTKLDERVLDCYVNALKEFIIHPDNDLKLSNIRKEIKKEILKLLKINNAKIIFTSGGTEANNLAILGFSKKFNQKKHFITSSYEHPSVLNSFKELERLGHKVTYINPNNEGKINVEDIIKEINKDTVMVSIMAVNNELGVINDIEKIIYEVKKINQNIIIHSDCVQAIGNIDINLYNKIDLISMSAHKIHGLKGSGLLLYKDNIKIDNILFGGHNEAGIRPGTQDLAKELAFLKALELYLNKNNNDNFLYLKNELKKLDNIEVNVEPDCKIININVKSNYLGEVLKNKLKENNIIVSTKSACSSNSKEDSIVLKSLKIDEEKIKKSIRISISKNTTKEEIDYLISILRDLK